jgi:hypothetical protein
MNIVLTKFTAKPSIISCIRNDGSITWQSYGNQSNFFPVHDLTHYVVETELNYVHAFYGMIATGRDIDDFGPGDAALFHPEALYAEMLAGLLTAVEGRGSSLNFEEIRTTIDAKMIEKGMSPIALTEAQLVTIRSRSKKLAEEWGALRAGEKMVLVFNPVR